MNFLDQIDKTIIPRHIAIIMDGNGRWAKKQGQIRLYGHSFGVESVRGALKAAKNLGVKYLTLYTFSTENWNRPQEEIDGLMELLVKTISSETDELNENGVRLLSIGDKDGLPEACRSELDKAIERTSHNSDIHLVLALNYSARWEITNAVKAIGIKAAKGEIDPLAISDETISAHLSTARIPDPELLIRTSGEHRLSNFLLWQLAYTELHFTQVLWPDFREDDLYKAVIDYQSRERRFGMVSEQL
jgi:undecaprenyl diphosphate synthase